MHDNEIQPFVGKPVRMTLADGRVLAGTLHAHGEQGHGHMHYAIVSDPVKPGGENVVEMVHGSDQVTEVVDASDDPAAVE
jgi:hypothetical protein